MPLADGVRAGKAFVEISAKDRLTKTLKRIGDSMQSLGARMMRVGSSIANVGRQITTAFIDASKVFADMGDQIGKMANRTGFTAEALSEIGFAAEQSGASLEQFDRALAAMARFSVQAERKLTSAKDILKLLGVTLEDFNAADPERRFMLLAEGIAGVKNPSLQAGLALTVFGRQGRELLPLLKEGSEGIGELRKQARDLGLSMSGEDAKSAEDYTDRMNELWRVIKQGVFTIGASLAPTLIDLTKKLTTGAVAVLKFVEANRPLIVVAAKIGAGIIALGVAIASIGGTLAVAGFTISGITTALAAVPAVFGTIAAVIGAVLSPVGLLVAGIVAAGAAFLHFTGIGRAAFGFLKGKFLEIAEIGKQAFGGISRALKAGDLKLAARIAMAGAKLAFLKATKEIRMTWARMTFALTDTWLSFVDTVNETLQAIGLDLQTMADGIGTIVDGLKQAIQAVRSRLGAPSGRLGIGSPFAGTQESRKKAREQFEKAQAEISAGIQEAAEEFDSLNRAAREAAEALERIARSTGPTQPRNLLRKGGGLDAGAGIGGGRGAFSAAAAALLGRGGPMTEMVDAQHTTNDLIRELIKEAGSIPVS